MTYKDLPKLTRRGSYQVDVPMDYLKDHINKYIVDYGLKLCPDFQRGRVWTVECGLLSRKPNLWNFC